MATYLLTINPEKGEFTDEERAMTQIKNGESYHDSWRVQSGRIKAGDRVFLLRQGRSKPRGIIAEGFVTRGSYRSTAKRNGTGGPAFRVDFELRKILSPDEQPVPWPLPGREYRGKFKGPLSSGKSAVSDEIAADLENMWTQRFLINIIPFDLAAALKGQPERAARDIQRRRGQSGFRDDLLKSYGRRCGLSDCDAEAALEAAHIVPYSGEAANHFQNGILLRADLHTLFDLHLFSIDPETLTVKIDASLKGASYDWLSCKHLNLPTKLEWRPSAEALRFRASLKARP